jgi:hypothetical protein
MTPTKPLPCPTCDRAPTVEERDFDIAVYCRNCYEPGAPFGTAWTGGPDWINACERAIDAWNDYVRDLVPDESEES